MNLLNVLLLTPPAQGTEGGTQGTPGIQMIIMFGLLFVVFYFFMIRPQMKKQKELKNFRSTIKKGDSVISTGGIYGKVADIKEDYLLVEVDNNVRLKIDKNAILKEATDLQQKK